jgi:molybdate transport system substrate-binding protein
VSSRPVTKRLAARAAPRSRSKLEQMTTRVMTALAALVFGSVVQAAEITVLSGGAIESGLKAAAAAAFEKQTGHKVEITLNTTPQMRKRVDDGGTFDVMLGSPLCVSAGIE